MSGLSSGHLPAHEVQLRPANIHAGTKGLTFGLATQACAKSNRSEPVPINALSLSSILRVRESRQRLQSCPLQVASVTPSKASLPSPAIHGWSFGRSDEICISSLTLSRRKVSAFPEMPPNITLRT
jgi:hypothetical protein